MVLVAGGFNFNNGGSLASAELYDPAGVGMLNLLSAASRETHGTAGAFDIPLPGDGSGIEDRTAERRTVVFSFNHPIANPGTASISPCGTTGSATIDPNDSHNVLANVNLSGCNQMRETVSLVGLTDVYGAEDDFSTSFGVLFGDAAPDGAVNNADLVSVRGNLGQRTNGGNFRSDVNADGRINQRDVGVLKEFRGTSLPPE